MKPSNPGGTDAGAVVAWQIALNQTEISLGLEDFDIMSGYIIQEHDRIFESDGTQCLTSEAHIARIRSMYLSTLSPLSWVHSEPETDSTMAQALRLTPITAQRARPSLL